MLEPPAPGLTDAALVVLIGASGSGKSTWAAANYRATEIVSSDQLRAVVGAGPADLGASVEAFDVLDVIVAARVRRRLTVVIDTLGLDKARRLRHLQSARAAGLRAVAVVFDTPSALCRVRNAGRDRPVPASALGAQLKRAGQVLAELSAEGWDEVLIVRDAPDAPGSPPGSPPANPAGQPSPPVVTTTASKPQLEFVLQISRFPWDEDPAGWLGDVARAAAEAGFSGIALMDHLIQIPQVGRVWEPIPEPWVTLGLLAGLGLGLRLGTLVSPVTFRAPGVIAKAAATLDVLSGGRAFCGLGAGWWEREHLGFGLPFPGPGKRLDQLERCIETMRALWSPGTKAHSGRYVDLPETTCYPRPVGDLPIVVGGAGDRMLGIAARLADGCNLQGDPAVLADRIATLRRLCADVGRDVARVAVTVLDVPVIGRDRDAVASRIERVRGRSSPKALAHRAGTPDEQIRRYRTLAELGVGTIFLSPAELRGPADVTEFAPVVRAFR